MEQGDIDDVMAKQLITAGVSKACSVIMQTAASKITSPSLPRIIPVYLNPPYFPLMLPLCITHSPSLQQRLWK